MPKIKKLPNGTYVKRFRYKNAVGEWKDGYVSARTRAECEEKYIRRSIELQASIQNGNYITVQDLYEQYITASELKLKHSSLDSMAYVIRLHILPYFGNKRIKNITLSDVEKWKRGIDEQGYKYKYKSKIFCGFNSMMNYAVKHEYIARNVVSLAGDFRDDEIKEEVPIWTLDDFKKVYAVIDDLTWRSYFTFLFFTGARMNEATCLSWTDFGADFKHVTINKTISHKGCADGLSYEITRPKTRRSNRAILLPDCLRNELKAHYDECRRVDGFSDNSFVWGVTTPLAENTIRRRLNSYAAKAGVPRIQVKGLRHSHDSYLHDLGVDDFEIATISGRTVQVTNETYIHTYTARHDAIRQRMDTDL